MIVFEVQQPVAVRKYKARFDQDYSVSRIPATEPFKRASPMRAKPRAALGSRMRVVVRLLQSFDGDVRVDLGGREISMSE